MKISEVIKKLQESQKEHGDVEIFAIVNTYGTGEWVPLEDFVEDIKCYLKGLPEYIKS